MANFTAGTSFTDGVTNDVTAEKLRDLVEKAVPTSSLALASTSGTISLFSSGTGTAATPAIQPIGDTNTGIFFPAADTIAFSEGGAEAMRIDANGNLNIGTVSAAGNTLRYVDVQNTTASASSGVDIRLITSDSAGTGTAIVDLVKYKAGGFTIANNETSSSGFTSFNVGASERLRIDSSGGVGIGTASPVSTLQVVGSLVLNGGNTSNTTLTSHNGILLGGVAKNSSPTGGQNAIEIVSNDSSNRLEGGITLQTSATAANRRITIGVVEQGVAWRNITLAESGGNVGIGTANPSAQLELSTDSAKKPSTNTWTIASDQRLKTNITNADNDRCYEIVKQVPLKRYTWKSEVYSQEKVKDRSKLGWIAQDVEEVFPKAVGTSRFAYNQVFDDVVTPELDSDGNAVLDENGIAKTKTEKRLVSEDVIEDCKDLNSDQIYAAMYGTIQKLIEKVESLESKIAALEAA